MFALTTKVKAYILDNSKLNLMQINVETFKGVVQLSGFVDSNEIAAKAAEVAKTVKGVKKVNLDSTNKGSKHKISCFCFLWRALNIKQSVFVL